MEIVLDFELGNLSESYRFFIFWLWRNEGRNIYDIFFLKIF